MKKSLYFVMFIFFVYNFSLFSYEIEKLGIIDDIYFEWGNAGGPNSPNVISVDEIKGVLEINNKTSKYKYYDVCNNLKGLKNKIYEPSFGLTRIILNDVVIDYADNYLSIASGAKKYNYSFLNLKCGISFILKNKDSYLLYCLDENGKPLAVDTKGNVYSNIQAMDFLKEYDFEKYEQSRTYANKIGVLGLFDLSEILIWGTTLYTTSENIYKYLNIEKYRAGNISYDLNGFSYQINYSQYESYVLISKGKDIILYLNDLNDIFDSKGSNNLKEYEISFYVGFGGNVYFYFTNNKNTEVFRIRNTWDSTNLYALAINGYTEDFYGDYVKDVLPKMSKADLRLLRNTVFALYGVHFKSEDLAKYFDKQVWYTDEGKSSGEVTLPENRQKLVEMILKLEK